MADNDSLRQAVRLPGLTLSLVGFLVLFLELACIRWFSASVVFLQFFTNVVLIASFLGISCGCLATGRRRDWLVIFHSSHWVRSRRLFRRYWFTNFGAAWSSTSGGRPRRKKSFLELSIAIPMWHSSLCRSRQWRRVSSCLLP